jgi:PAS domain S-box-containing protein
LDRDLGEESSEPERPGILSGLAQRLQEGVRATIEALGQSQAQRLAAIVESSDDAILSVDLEGTIATWNRGAEKLFGYLSEEVIGGSVLMLIPADRQSEEPDILERIRRGEHVKHYETVRRSKDGRPVPVSLSVSPIIDASGTIIGASKIARDMTERRRTEEQQGALHEFTDRLFRAASEEDIYQAALDAIIRALGCERASILLFDASGNMKFVACRGLSDGYRRAVEGHSPWTRDATDPQPITLGDIDAADLDPSLKATVKAEGIGALAFIPLTEKGRLVGKFMTYYKAPQAFTEAEIVLAVTIARQLGFSLERRSAEQAKELLLSESQHRIKNTLATVQAIAGQTLRHTPPAERESFQARLHALGEAHDLLTSANWNEAPLREVVAHALKPFEGKDRRVIVEGPLISLPARTSLLLTLCLHELATNAVKYGALSNGTGHVHIGWQPAGNGEQRKVRLSWRESGGPPVAVPSRKGFGSLLIETSFGGTNQQPIVEFRPQGLRCLLDLPL